MLAIGSFILYKLEPLLKYKEDFDRWFDGIVKILKGYSL